MSNGAAFNEASRWSQVTPFSLARSSNVRKSIRADSLPDCARMHIDRFDFVARQTELPRSYDPAFVFSNEKLSRVHDLLVAVWTEAAGQASISSAYSVSCRFPNFLGCHQPDAFAIFLLRSAIVICEAFQLAG